MSTINERDRVMMEGGPTKPSISRKTGFMISTVGLVGTFSAIISCVVLSLVDQREYLQIIAPATLVMWIVWKAGKTIVRMHDNADYEVNRNRELQDAEHEAQSEKQTV